jgi:hypothetical protein
VSAGGGAARLDGGGAGGAVVAAWAARLARGLLAAAFLAAAFPAAGLLDGLLLAGAGGDPGPDAEFSALAEGAAGGVSPEEQPVNPATSIAAAIRVRRGMPRA